MKPLFALVAVAVCAGAGWSVYRSSLAATEAAVDDASQEELPAVRIEPVRRELVRDCIELVGGLEPLSAVELRAAVAGYVVNLPFDLGDRVEVGTVVAELDDAQARESLVRSEAALKVAQARLKAQEATAEHARRELTRWQRLEKSGVSTGQQLDAAESQVAVAASQVELERAQVEQVAAELEQVRLQLAQTKVRAPASGFVAERLVSVGHLASPDLPLLRLVAIDTVRTIIHVPEQDYQRVRSGQPATVSVDALPDREFAGEVVRKAPVLDPATRTAAVEIEIPNAELLLKPGMYAHVSIIFDERTVTVVPLAALREDSDSRAVYVVSGDPPIARRVEVDAGVIDGNRVEIRDGVEEDDWVVVLGHDSIGPDGVVQALRGGEKKLVAEEPRIPAKSGGGPG